MVVEVVVAQSKQRSSDTGAVMVGISEFVWDEWNQEHIAEHGVDTDEVTEVSRNAPYITRARDDHYRVIGQTDGGRFLTLYVARRDFGRYYAVPARDATQSERRSYRRR